MRELPESSSAPDDQIPEECWLMVEVLTDGSFVSEALLLPSLKPLRGFMRVAIHGIRYLIHDTASRRNIHHSKYYFITALSCREHPATADKSAEGEGMQRSDPVLMEDQL